MSRKIVFKKSSVASKVPLASDLEPGEIAINLADKKLYSKDTSNNIIDLTPVSLNDLTTKIEADDYATATVGGTVKMRLDGTTLYITNNGNNA